MRRKIFATYDAVNNRACLKLSAIDQDVFSRTAPATIYPLKNKWGKQGWTIIEMKGIKKKLLSELLARAYCTVAPARLAVVVEGAIR